MGIDGFKFANHLGEQDAGGFILSPATAQALKTPVVASGGIADGRGLPAAAVGLRRDQHGNPIDGHSGGPHS